jgi:hypothetical protein
MNLQYGKNYHEPCVSMIQASPDKTSTQVHCGSPKHSWVSFGEDCAECAAEVAAIHADSLLKVEMGEEPLEEEGL